MPIWNKHSTAICLIVLPRTSSPQPTPPGRLSDLVVGGVSVPGFPTVQELETIRSEGSAPEEAEWMETLRDRGEHCNSQLVENSPRMVNQLTKVSEILPSVVDQLTTLANQEKLDNQPASG